MSALLKHLEFVCHGCELVAATLENIEAVKLSPIVSKPGVVLEET